MSIHEIKEFSAVTGLTKPILKVADKDVVYKVIEAMPLLIVGSDPEGRDIPRLEREELAFSYTVGTNLPIDESEATLEYIRSYVDFKDEAAPDRKVRLRVFQLHLEKKPSKFLDRFRSKETEIITVATLRHYTGDVLKHQAVVLVNPGANTPLEIINLYGKRVNKQYCASCKKNEILDDGVFTTVDTLMESGHLLLTCEHAEPGMGYSIKQGDK